MIIVFVFLRPLGPHPGEEKLHTLTETAYASLAMESGLLAGVNPQIGGKSVSHEEFMRPILHEAVKRGIALYHPTFSPKKVEELADNMRVQQSNELTINEEMDIARGLGATDEQLQEIARQGKTGLPLLDVAIQASSGAFQQDERLQPEGKGMDELTKSIRKHEGEKRNKDGKHVVYEDSEGFPTVGYGHKVTKVDGLKVGDTIDDAKADQLFNQDIEKAKSGAKTVITNFDALPDEVRHILTEMVYQMGASGVKKFENTLEHIKNGDYKKAAQEMLNSEWAKQTPSRAKALAERMERLA